MIVTLSGPKTVTQTPAVTKTISSITIIAEIDYPTQKKVVVNTKELGNIVLWSGAAYDAAGQWTDADVQAKLLALYNV